MEKSKALEKLKELGIDTNNFYDKKTFIKSGEVCIGIFPVEANREENFYFSINTEEELFTLSREVILKEAEQSEHMGKMKYEIALSHAKSLWKDSGVFTERPDDNFKSMTIRDFAAIHWKKPISDKAWLNALIQKNN